MKNSVFTLKRPLPDGDTYLAWEDRAVGKFPCAQISQGILGVLREGEKFLRLKRKIRLLGITFATLSILTFLTLWLAK